MHELTIQFIGPVRRPGSERTLTIDPTGLQTVGDLLGRLGYSGEERQALHVLVDGTRRPLEGVIEGADRVEILVAIGGG